MLTGRKLFNVKDELALTSSVLNETPPRLSAVAAQPIPRELDELVAACVEKRREDRPQRITDLIQILELIAQQHARWTQRDAEAAWRATSLAP
jgi:serine/threonine-protein kinase